MDRARVWIEGETAKLTSSIWAKGVEDCSGMSMAGRVKMTWIGWSSCKSRCCVECFERRCGMLWAQLDRR
jgi:hypothetical protein